MSSVVRVSISTQSGPSRLDMFSLIGVPIKNYRDELEIADALETLAKHLRKGATFSNRILDPFDDPRYLVEEDMA